METLIETSALTKSFGEVKAVDRLSLSIPKGEVFGLLGPNGAGKTTTIRMLSALIKPTKGTAVINGIPLGENNKEIRKNIGLLTESPGMYERLSAHKNLTFFASLYEVENVEKQVEHYLKLLGLWDRKDDEVGAFSKGMRQKLAIARALIHEPVILLLDEPTSGLDPEASKMVRESIEALKQEGRTIILCTHNLEEADRLCDRVAVFNTRLLALDSPAKLREKLFGRKVIVQFADKAALYEKDVQALPFITHCKTEENSLIISLDSPETNNPILIKTLINNGAKLQYVKERNHSLEEVYLHLLNNKELE
jgi:ABC-2 type transport system ATP-binding protein